MNPVFTVVGIHYWDVIIDKNRHFFGSAYGISDFRIHLLMERIRPDLIRSYIYEGVVVTELATRPRRRIKSRIRIHHHRQVFIYGSSPIRVGYQVRRLSG